MKESEISCPLCELKEPSGVFYVEQPDGKSTLVLSSVLRNSILQAFNEK